jgi:hypothetical protein
MRVHIKAVEKAAFLMHVVLAVVLFGIVVHLDYPDIIEKTLFEPQSLVDTYSSACLLPEMNACGSI